MREEEHKQNNFAVEQIEKEQAAKSTTTVDTATQSDLLLNVGQR